MGCLVAGFMTEPPATFNLTATAADGMQLDPQRLTIRVQLDRRPEIKFVQPPEELVVTPTTEVPMIVEANDDIAEHSREIPPLLSAWKRLRTRPDVIIVDGQGIAHPRRLGIASHLGLVLDVPTIGCAKSRLCGEHEEPRRERGAWTPLVHKGEPVGVALRTREGCNVVYVSTGHRIGLKSAISVVLACAPRYRLPEPQRLADQLTRQ